MKLNIYSITLVTSIILSACTAKDGIESDLNPTNDNTSDLVSDEVWQYETGEMFKHFKYENDSCICDITLEEALEKGLSEKAYKWGQNYIKKLNDRIQKDREKGINLKYHFPQNERRQNDNATK